MSSYEGTENLEAMRHAVRYNRFLTDLVVRAGRGAAHAVDFGSGTGTFALAVQGRGLEIRCVEPDEALAQRLSGLGFEVSPSLQTLERSSQPFVYSLNVLEHIDDDQQAMEAIARILEPGGRVLIYVPAFQVLYSAMDTKVGHRRRYRRRSLCAMVERAGLIVDEARYIDVAGFAASLVYRVLRAPGTLDPGTVARYDRWVFPVSRALDRLPGLPGKNVYVIATKPSADPRA